MGYPLSTFQQLSRLCRDEHDVVAGFSAYKAVAVVVHEPHDRKFRMRMKSAFERLHESTGPDFAFITFTNPSMNWMSEHREWMDVQERVYAGGGGDDPAFLHALQDRLVLPEGPCLILTDDLLSADYVILGTSADRFVEQLESIGAFAQAQEHRFPAVGPEFTTFLSSLGPVWAERTSDGRSLAANIADLIAVPALTGRGESQRREAEEHVRRTIRDLREALERARGDEASTDADGILGRLSDYMALLAKSAGTDLITNRNMPVGSLTIERHTETEMFSIGGDECRGMEHYSWNCLMNYNRLLPLYFSPDVFRERSRVDLDHLTDGELLLDYSPLGSFLGKAVEEEVNASLVQRLRNMLGVSMPEFYRLYEDGLDEDRCLVPTRKKPIRFNQKGRPAGDGGFADCTVTIGDTVYAARYLRDRCDEGAALGPFGAEECLNDLYWFSRRRNDACHNSRFGEEEFLEIHRRFRGILEGYLPEMVRLKRRLRDRGDDLLPL